MVQAELKQHTSHRSISARNCTLNLCCRPFTFYVLKKMAVSAWGKVKLNLLQII